MRGFFDFLNANPVYTNTDKNWHVELQSCTYTWFDTIIDPTDGFDTAGMMRKYLRQLREHVKNHIDKHFVYYLASRVKVRFHTQKKPRYRVFNKSLVFYIEIGRARKLKKYAIKIGDIETGKIVKPKIEITERYITLHNKVGGKITLSVYEFLDMCECHTGISSEVHYVGYTQNPATRPLDRDHRGFSDMLYWTMQRDEDYDYFIFYNLFKVTAIGLDQQFNLGFVFANAMTNEVNVVDEALILEKALIKYFDTKPQALNKPRESAELNNRLATLATRHRIQSITFDLSLASPRELFRFYSERVAPTDRHNFTCQHNGTEAEIVPAKTTSWENLSL